MPREHLRVLLRDLERELESLEVSKAERIRLEKVRVELRNLLDHEDSDDAEHGKIVSAVLDSVRSFEHRHPNLSYFLTEASDLLGRMGI